MKEPDRAVMAVLWAAMGLICVVAWLCESFLLPERPAGSARYGCAANMRQLGVLWSTLRAEHAWFRSAGMFAWIECRQRGVVSTEQEAVLRCRQDAHLLEASRDASSPLYDLVDAGDETAIRLLCSYAGRDFDRYPLPADDDGAEAIACDAPGPDGVVRNHPGGLNVLFSDTNVKFMDHEALGISEDTPITIGPDSPIELLRPLVVVPERDLRDPSLGPSDALLAIRELEMEQERGDTVVIRWIVAGVLALIGLVFVFRRAQRRAAARARLSPSSSDDAPPAQF